MTKVLMKIENRIVQEKKLHIIKLFNNIKYFLKKNFSYFRSFLFNHELCYTSIWIKF